MGDALEVRGKEVFRPLWEPMRERVVTQGGEERKW